MPDGYVSLVPDGALGSTWYGTTPEEADLMGSSEAEVYIVNTGVAIEGANISLMNCKLGVEALTILFENLPAISTAHTIDIAGNPGDSEVTDEQIAIATEKDKV